MNITDTLCLDRLVQVRLVDHFVVLGDGLVRPKVVLCEQWLDLLDALELIVVRSVLQFKFFEQIQDVGTAILSVLQVVLEESLLEYVEVDAIEALHHISLEVFLTA